MTKAFHVGINLVFRTVKSCRNNNNFGAIFISKIFFKKTCSISLWNAFFLQSVLIFIFRPKSYAVPDPRPDSGVERITSPIRDLELNSRSDRVSNGRHTPDFFIPVSRLSSRTSGSEATRSDRSDSPALRGNFQQSKFPHHTNSCKFLFETSGFFL